MVSMQSFVADYIVPASLFILLIIVIPYTPRAIRKFLKGLLWDRSLTIAGRSIRIIHLFVGVFGVIAGLKYNEMVNYDSKHDGMVGSLPLDIKGRKHKAERDFYLFMMVFAIWIYIWRLYKIMSTYQKLSRDAN
jgi:hypothetical protein